METIILLAPLASAIIAGFGIVARKPAASMA